jgi:hypothetical protein
MSQQQQQQQQQPLAQMNTNAAASLQSNDVTAMARPGAAAADADELPPLEDNELTLGDTSSTSFCTIERNAHETVFWSPPDTVVHMAKRNGWSYTEPLHNYLHRRSAIHDEEPSRFEEWSTEPTN